MKAIIIMLAALAALATPAAASDFRNGDRVTVNTNTRCDGTPYAKPFSGVVRGTSAKGNVVVQPDGCSRTRVFLRFMVEPRATGHAPGEMVEVPRADLEALDRIIDRLLGR